jgi:aspartate carbamoyltransferase catalytic subunit
VADIPARSISTQRGELGVAMRMACLEVLTRRARGIPGWGDGEWAKGEKM